MKRILPPLLGLLLLAGSTELAQAQDIIHHPRPQDALQQRWAWAQAEAQSRSLNRYWIGYSIQRLMGEKSFTGTFYSPRRDDLPTLEERLYNRTTPDPDAGLSDDEVVRREAQRMLETYDRADTQERMVWKDVALLFAYDRRTGELEKVMASNITLHVNLREAPLLWLGEAENGPSIALLQGLYADAREVEPQERLVMGIGMHQAPAQVVPFMAEVLKSRADDEVREKAAFWVSQQDDDRALPLLLDVVQNDRSEDVREQAVFGISQVETPAATEALIDLARREQNRSVRKKAIFWLGQKASNQAIATLKDVVYDDEDTEIQKQAIFALSQQDKDQAVPLLIEVARTHKNPKVRKQAIFWLGQTDDPRALDALVEFVRQR